MSTHRKPMRRLGRRLAAATAPTPSWSLTDPATWTAIAAIVSTILVDFVHVGHADQYVRLGLLIATGLILPTVALAKHALAFGGWIADLSDALSEIAAAMHPQTVMLPPGDTVVDHSNMKLGRGPKRDDPRTFRLASYATAKRWRSPAKIDWTSRVAGWPMMANDRLGDCTCAAAGHMLQAWTANANPPSIVVSDEQVIAMYSAVTGYSPSKAGSDRGAVELDVLNYWRQAGLAGRKITAFASLDVKRKDEVRYAIAEFGAAYTGISLPLTAQTQQVWDVVAGGEPDSAPGSWGGHAVPYVAYNAVGPVCVTWGRLKQITWAFHFAYCEEAYCVLSPDWFPSGGGKSPGGFDMSKLNADLAAL